MRSHAATWAKRRTTTGASAVDVAQTNSLDPETVVADLLLTTQCGTCYSQQANRSQVCTVPRSTARWPNEPTNDAADAAGSRRWSRQWIPTGNERIYGGPGVQRSSGAHRFGIFMTWVGGCRMGEGRAVDAREWQGWSQRGLACCSTTNGDANTANHRHTQLSLHIIVISSKRCLMLSPTMAHLRRTSEEEEGKKKAAEEEREKRAGGRNGHPRTPPASLTLAYIKIDQWRRWQSLPQSISGQRYNKRLQPLAQQPARRLHSTA